MSAESENNRRESIKASAGTLALMAGRASGRAADTAIGVAEVFVSTQSTVYNLSPSRRPIKKGIMWATVGVKGTVLEKMKAIKEAGFDGVEMMSHMDQDEVLRARDET